MIKTCFPKTINSFCMLEKCFYKFLADLEIKPFYYQKVNILITQSLLKDIQ